MAAGSDVMASAADMISAVDFSGTAFDSSADSVEDLSSPGPLEETPAVEDTPDVPADVPAEADEQDDQAQPEPEVATDQPELPEGVREVDVNGKKELRVTPSRWSNIYGSHQTLRAFEEAIGEPATAEVLDLRNRAYMGQERLYSDLLSGEPESQGKVLGHFIEEAQRAMRDGEVGTDPTINLGLSMYEALQQKAPDAYAHLRMRQATDLVSDMYTEAQRSGDKNLAVSASHIARALGIPYKKSADISQFLATPPANADPVANLRAENQRLQEQLHGRDSETVAAQFRSWKSDATKAVTSGVLSEAVMPSLSAEQKAWEKFPTQFENLVVAPLNKAVKQTIGEDKNFAARIQLLEQSARRATSAQRRDEIAGQIKQAYVNRAKLAVDAHKSGILREAAVLLKKGSDATHARHQSAQQQRGPRGSQTPAPRSLTPEQVVNPGGLFDAKAEAARLSRLLG